MYIIILGSIFDGHDFYGPYENFEAAKAAVEMNENINKHIIVQLNSPEDFALVSDEV